MERTFLTNHFLIAMPTLTDPNFNRAVIYLCEHGEEGAVGIVINAPLNITLEEVYTQMKLESPYSEINELPVLFGGPVQQERGFVIHRPFGEWSSSLNVTEDIAVTTSQDILQAVAEKKGPPEVLVALGYAGWTTDQLEHEIMQNMWLTVAAEPRIIFDTPFELRWEKAAGLLGIDVRTLSGEAGHA